MKYSGTTEIITDIASSFGTTTYDDGTAPMVTAKTSLISDGTTLSNPTTLEPTENTISDGMTGKNRNTLHLIIYYCLHESMHFLSSFYDPSIYHQK